ncbi:hypothetical protein CSHISOI_10016 [Colletotrichum shisoi]|uniref:T6SS Phospholipase effector Tle1-like catalytic domain-containing protein n=1 Tax=Colletotrichum shisoi TaxID=2078593 RepID=A0A5Q4BET4_9PEZI|nr:hypothetical protein CSHISOI_10016 [Colletotrichum shisoi]
MEPPVSTNSSDLWRSFVVGSSDFKPKSVVPPALDFSGQVPSSQIYTLEQVDELQVKKKSTVSDVCKKAHRKKIIICCDGTWQSSVSGETNVPSNVTRLARSMALTGEDEDGNTCQQIVYYSAGIGTGAGVGIIDRGRQAGFGDGLDARVFEAYSFIVTNYAPDDQIYCFGFSRGAYTARSVAGLITDIGIIQPRDLDDFPDLYHLYRQRTVDSFNFRKSKDFREWVTGVREEGFEYLENSPNVDDHWIKIPHRLPPEFTRIVEVVGVFDTVGALGVPGWGIFESIDEMGIPVTAWYTTIFNQVVRFVPFTGIDILGFHNTSLSRYIKHAFHALSLDEHQRAFTPTLWRLPGNDDQRPQPSGKPRAELAKELRDLVIQKNGKPSEKKLSQVWEALIESEMAEQLEESDESKLLQVWFPGSHINIGGGNPLVLWGFPCDCEQLALLSFTWMCDQISKFVRIDDEQKKSDDPRPRPSSSLADREIESRRKLIRSAKINESLWWNRLLQPVRTGFNHTGFFESPLKAVPDDADDAWATGPVVEMFEPFMKFVPFLSKYRTPGEYKKDSAGNDLGQTNEKMHPSVHYRVAIHPSYRPRPLEGFLRCKNIQAPGRPRYEWKKGDVVIPEYVIKDTDYVSRRLAERSRGGKEFLASLDGTK